MEADLRAQGKSTYQKANVLKFKYFHLQVRDLEGAPLEELEEIPTSTRTTGREIDLVLQQERSGARTVMGHATGMTVTVVGADVNRSKHYIIWVFLGGKMFDVFSVCLTFLAVLGFFFAPGPKKSTS